MRSARGPIIVAAALLTALTGCGAGGETPTFTEQLIAGWADMTDVFNEMADAVGGIDSQASANAVAVQIEGEFQPRANSIMEALYGAVEALSEEERATLHQTMSEDEEVRAAFERLNRSAARFDERSMQLETRFVTSAFEESMLAFVQGVEQYEGRLAAIVGEGTAQPEVGDAAWCREMANKPEAQWTMNEALAFANRCVGG